MVDDITYLGKIIRVDTNSIEVEMSDSIPSATPIINGRIYKIGQIGTFVKIPIGNIVNYGIVTAVSNTPSKTEENKVKLLYGSRFLTIQLIGEKVGNLNFEKGIGTYPTINDEVHIVVEKDLYDIYGQKDDGSIEIGKHSSSDNLKIFVDVHKLVLRHCAVLGSTGSGKSNATITILKSILSDCCGSRVILVDPHGEYSSAFPNAKVFKIGSNNNSLFIPFWLMNFDELAYFLVGAKPIDDQRTDYRMFRELVVNLKKENCNLKAGLVDINLVTADSPIPFSARKLWHEMNWWLNATFDKPNKEDQTVDCVREINKGDYDRLIPAEFEPYVIGSPAPHKSKHQDYYSYEKKVLTRLRDSRYDFLFNPGEYKDASSSKDLHDLLNEWIGSPNQLVILDLSGVPFEVLDITIGLITRFIYDSMFWGREEEYTGKNRPLLLAFEEAHNYLNKNDTNSYSRKAVEKIFKEGRKFGIGAMVISQRPSEISDTILAQVGTFISLRLSNSSDQSIVKSLAPDNLNSIIDLLPSLRIGEAIVVGESIKIPSRVRMELNTPQPTSSDPDLVSCWHNIHHPNCDNYKSVVTRLREQKLKLEGD